MNSSNNNTICNMKNFSNDLYDVILNIFRFSVFFLYIIWVLIAIIVKKFHRKQMVFLINLCAVGIFYCLSGFSTFFREPCVVPDLLECHVSLGIALYCIYYIAFPLSTVALHRMASTYFTDIDTRLKYNHILIVLLVIWLFPLMLTIAHMYAFKSKIFFSHLFHICVYDSFGSIEALIVYTVFCVILPNLIIIISYIFVLLRLYKIKKRVKTFSSEFSLEPPRITIQLVIYILTFEISCIANFILIYQTTLVGILVSDDLLKILRILRWLHHVCPLGLLYFHSELLKIYKNLIQKIRS